MGRIATGSAPPDKSQKNLHSKEYSIPGYTKLQKIWLPTCIHPEGVFVWNDSGVTRIRIQPIDCDQISQHPTHPSHHNQMAKPKGPRVSSKFHLGETYPYTFIVRPKKLTWWTACTRSHTDCLLLTGLFTFKSLYLASPSLEYSPTNTRTEKKLHQTSQITYRRLL